jgi:hypothetical protein
VDDVTAKAAAKSSIVQKPFDGEDCAICFEPLAENAKDKLVWCRRSCGKTLHQVCFNA